ncbi:galactosyltransferase-related protein [Chitinophaga sp.]|uniref:galactosyltransferase-related protein n=1 Tax=Chitinophaga sp. TaxID=1869181 RepID=UPI002F94D243
MIFLSAQPDSEYFVWQLKIQLYNFRKFSIDPDTIHILIGYNREKGIHPNVAQLAVDYKEYARFFFYPDTRISARYLSSIRPNIIKQHFAVYPQLESEIIFYHDSDIVFTESLPDFDRLCKDDIWYVSNAKEYLNTRYIRQFGEDILDNMCRIMNIDKSVVVGNDENAGGAQYLLKKVDYNFWQQLEDDSEAIYIYLSDEVNTIKHLPPRINGKKRNYIQAWCADMWAILWSSFKKATVVIDKELDFCWPSFHIDTWGAYKIYHNAGVLEHEQHEYFYKSKYTEYSPFYEYLNFVLPHHCNYKYVELIKEVRDTEVFDLTDVTFIIPIRIDSVNRIENLRTSVGFLTRYFRTNILILEADLAPKVPEDITGNKMVTYLFIEDDDPILNRTMYNNLMAEKADTPVIVKYDADVIIAPGQMYNSVCAIRNGRSIISYPYDGRFLDVRDPHRAFFLEDLDITMLFKYMDDFTQLTFPSVGGCIVVNRQDYLAMGGDNEYFIGWGLEDKELYFRSRILNGEVHRAVGPLFHLSHARGLNSFYTDNQAVIDSHREFLKVAEMDKAGLLTYIESWGGKNGK